MISSCLQTPKPIVDLKCLFLHIMQTGRVSTYPIYLVSDNRDFVDTWQTPPWSIIKFPSSVLTTLTEEY